MLVTVMTDAAVDHKLKIGGYGYWIVSNRGSQGGGGQLKPPIKDSYEGELKAAVNTIHKAIVSGFAQRGDTILLQTDSQAVVILLSNRKRPKRKEILEPFLYVVKLLYDSGVHLKVRHVKGHTCGSHGSRFAANNHCDTKAKEHLRVQRAVT